MIPSDETLGAYVDGELDASARAEVEAAIASDAGVAQRAERMRAVRNQLLAAFSGATQEPVPQRLIDTLHMPPRTGVADLAQARAAKRPQRLRWTAPEWGALAASVAVAAVFGYFLLRAPEAGMFMRQQGQLFASGALAETLSHQLASEQARDAAIRIGLSFRDKSGEYCRTFALRDRAGLACRGSNQWQVHTLARAERISGGAEPAGSALPREVLRAVEARIAGDPLDAAGEAAARESNWGAR